MGWMAWTLPTAMFFAGIGMALVILTMWELRNPTVVRRGFLPMKTTRGDRFFISLLSAAFIHLAWLGLIGDWVLMASLLALTWGAILMRWG